MRRVILVLATAALVACGGPDPETIPIVGQVIGKVELPYGDISWLVDLPYEHRRCVVSTDDGVYCWSTLVVTETQP